jgi:hypothetical protein
MPEVIQRLRCRKEEVHGPALAEVPRGTGCARHGLRAVRASTPDRHPLGSAPVLD